MYVCDVFVYSELSAGGAKQDGCWALLSVGQLWPSDDDGDDDGDDVDGDQYQGQTHQHPVVVKLLVFG